MTDGAAPRPWLGVEMRHLASLCTVARTGSFRDAARELGYAQSAVSQHIARLERAVGTQLVERAPSQRGLALTPAGAVLRVHGDAILDQLRAARIDVVGLGAGRGPTLRLALAPDAPVELVGRLLAAVTRDLPDLGLHVQEVPAPDELVDRVKDGRADLAVGPVTAAAGIAWRMLMVDPLVLSVQPHASLAQQSSVDDPGQLADLDVVVSAATVSYAQLRAAGLAVGDVAWAPNAAAVAARVRAGASAGVLPASAAGAGAGDLVHVPADQLLGSQRVGLCWNARRRRTPALEAFRRAAETTTAAGADEPARRLRPAA